MWKQHGKETCETGAKHVLNSWKLNLLQEIFFMQIQLNSIRQLIGMKQYGSSPYCILHSSVLQYIVILQYVYDQTLLKIILRECLVHNYTCSMQLINVESQGQALIITFMYQFVILIFNLLKPTQYLAHTYNSTAIYCNILQYAIYRYSPLVILYCIAVVLLVLVVWLVMLVLVVWQVLMVLVVWLILLLCKCTIAVYY